MVSLECDDSTPLETNTSPITIIDPAKFSLEILEGSLTPAGFTKILVNDNEHGVGTSNRWWLEYMVDGVWEQVVGASHDIAMFVDTGRNYFYKTLNNTTLLLGQYRLSREIEHVATVSVEFVLDETWKEQYEAFTERVLSYFTGLTKEILDVTPSGATLLIRNDSPYFIWGSSTLHFIEKYSNGVWERTPRIVNSGGMVRLGGFAEYLSPGEIFEIYFSWQGVHHALSPGKYRINSYFTACCCNKNPPPYRLQLSPTFIIY